MASPDDQQLVMDLGRKMEAFYAADPEKTKKTLQHPSVKSIQKTLETTVAFFEKFPEVKSSNLISFKKL